MSEKQPNLLEVPRDHPPRAQKVDINAFKRKVGIWTHSVGTAASPPEFPKWTSLLLPTRGDGSLNYTDHKPYCKSDEPMDLMAGYCRVLDDSGRISYGNTEREAIQNLCNELNIPCNL